MNLRLGIRLLTSRLLCTVSNQRRVFTLGFFAILAPLAFAQSPTLTSAVPGIAIQGAGQLQMTLVGTNFRPGAIVVISPVLQALNQSTGKVQATDIIILSNTLVNANTLTARINVGTVAELGLRAIDVLNTDGTSTAGQSATGLFGSSQPFHVFPSNSIAAPLTVTNLALLTPRNGTVATQDEQLYAEAILTGSGTGTVIGQWIWDDTVFEEFTVEIKGGTSATFTTKQSLPTTVIGAHQLQLRMTAPNKLAAVPITIVVNPDGLSRERLIYPEISRSFDYVTTPRFLWAPVPGATKYQVGFSTTPYNSGVTEWFDVVDNRWEMPKEDWEKLPTGSFYWTVRAIDSNGIARQPLPLRPISRNIEGGLHALNARPARTASGHTLLQWKPIQTNDYYFVTISIDFGGENIIRQYMTTDATLDLRALDGKLQTGETYYYQIDAISPDGLLLSSGPVESFVAVAGPGMQSSVQTKRATLLASLGRSASLPSLADLASEISAQTPTPGSTTNLLQPAISVAFNTQVNPADVSLMVDDVDITALAQVSATKVSFTPPLALAGGDHNINLSVGTDATAWKFTVLAPPTPAAVAAATSNSASPTVQTGTDAEVPTTPVASGMPKGSNVAAAHKETAKAKKDQRPTLQGQLGASTQWVSGSNPPDTNVISASERMIYEKGPWHIEANGSGLLNSVLNPSEQRTSHGEFNDYVFQLGYKKLPWNTSFRFGIISPVLYTGAQFVTASTPRQGVELTIKSPIGTLGGFVNTNDTALGGGSGINFHQQIEGASYDAPLPKWAALRFMWLNANDTGVPTTVGYDSQGNPIILPNPIAPQSSGDVIGGLLKINFTKKWQWTSEYAISYFNPNSADPTSKREFGRAWRTGVTGQVNKLNSSFFYREESANFGNPANPSLTESSQPNLRGANANVNDTTKLGNFGITYAFLDNNVHPTTLDEVLMNSFNESWSKPLGKKANVSLSALQTFTTTGAVPTALIGQPPEVSGAVDSRDLSVNFKVSRKISNTTLSFAASRDWFRDNLTPTNDTITSSINVGANLANPKSFFKLSAQFNANWVAADGLTTGDSSTYTVYAQPSFNWKHPAVQVAPLLTVSKARTVLSSGTATSDTLTGQYGGRVSWTLPGKWKFSTISAQGSYNQNKDYVAQVEQDTTQLLVLWIITWKHKKVF